MGYIDTQRIVKVAEEFVSSIDSQRKSSFAPGYFRSQVSDIGRAFEKGEIKKEDLAGKIFDVLRSHKIYSSSNSEVNALKNTIKNL